MRCQMRQKGLSEKDGLSDAWLHGQIGCFRVRPATSVAGFLISTGKSCHKGTTTPVKLTDEAAITPRPIITTGIKDRPIMLRVFEFLSAFLSGP